MKEQEEDTRVDRQPVSDGRPTAASNEADPPSWCGCVTHCRFAVDEVTGRAEAGCIKHFNQGDDWLLRRKVLRAINAVEQTVDASGTLSVGTLRTLATLLRDIDEALVEAHDADAVNRRMGDLLTRTANALKGQPEPLHLHSWHDLPECALSAVSPAAGRETVVPTPEAAPRAGEPDA